MTHIAQERHALPGDHPADEIQMPFRGGGFTAQRRPIAALIFFLLLLIVWEGAVRLQLVSSLFLPAPTTIIQTLTDMLVSGELWRHVSVSLMRIVVGWSLGTIAGLVIGVAIGLWSNARAIGIPVVASLFPIPKIALMPLLIVWLGIGEVSKIMTLVLGVGFPTIITVYSAIDAAPRNLIRMAQSFNVPYWAVVWKVLLPSALASIVAGFRITTSIALVLLIAAEMLGAQYGLGALILSAGNMMLTERLLAGVVCLSILGLALSWCITRLEKRVTRWR